MNEGTDQPVPATETPRPEPFNVPLLVTVILLVGTFVVIDRMGVKKRIELKAVTGLRSIGAVQMAYQDANLNKDYGNFKALQTSGYIAPGITPSTLIPEYDLPIFRMDIPPMCNNCSSDCSFTIVAVPRNARRRLRTFAICDDQTVRVATDASPRGSSLLGPDPCFWEPLE